MFGNFPKRMLPPEDCWPDLVFPGNFSSLLLNRPHINCAELLWDIGISRRGIQGKIAFHVDGNPVKYKDILKDVNRFGNALKKLGVHEGDRIVFRFGDHLEAIITTLAVWKIGAICVPTQPLERAKELEYIFNDTECKFVVTIVEDIQEVEAALDNSPLVKNVIVVGNYKGGKAFLPFDALLVGEDVELEVAKTKPYDVNAIYYTGGTTGRPKGCLCTHAGEVAHALNVIEVRGTKLNDVHYCPLPVGHTFGNFEKVPNIIASGITSVLNKERYSPQQVLNTIEKYRVTKFIASPTVLRMISSSVNIEEYDLSSLRIVLCSGEVFDKKTFDEWTKKLGFEPWNGYGMTPFRGWLMCPAIGGKKFLSGRSVGKPLPGYEIRIVDKEGKDVSDGENGTLLVRGPTGICFLNNKHPDIKRYVEEDMNWGKYSRADDYFFKNSEGCFEFQARESILIRSAGRFVDPSEIEEVLHEHPAIKEAVVIGIPDAVRGEVPKAIVILKEGFEKNDDLIAELQGFIKQKIAAYKYPRVIEFVDEIEKDAVGKIQRKKLKEKAAIEMK